MANGLKLRLSNVTGDIVPYLTQKKTYIRSVIRISQEQKESTGRGGVWRNCRTLHYAVLFSEIRLLLTM